MAKLRTKTGCLTCRKRRKKCDETHDSCLNCSRNGLKCIWPTKDQEKDKRHLKRKLEQFDTSNNESRVSVQSLVVSNPPDSHIRSIFFNDVFSTGFQLSLDDTTIFAVPIQLSMVPTSTEESNSRALLASFVHDFLPSRIHPRSHHRFLDFSYLYDMALSYPTLLNACLACATSALGGSTNLHSAEAQMRANGFYARCIQSLRTTIQEGKCEGSEDWLLATVVILCLYENRQPGYDPKAAAAHIAAAGQVFRKRAETKLSATSIVSDSQLSSTQTWPTLIFERVFIEAFLYHCMVMSVQETSLTPLQDPILRIIFDDYFECPMAPTSPEAENWPVLGMHYQIVRLISDLLAALDSSQIEPGIQITDTLDDILVQLETWKIDTTLNHYGFHILLYISAAKLLGYHHLSVSSSACQHYFVLLQEELYHCMNSLLEIEVSEVAFTRYFYWPLAIIDKVVQDTRTSHIVQQKLKDMAPLDPAGKKAYNWIAKGFERRFKTGRKDLTLNL